MAMEGMPDWFAIVLSKNIRIPKIILKKSIGELMKLIQPQS
jgi:hypothetical protein